MCIDVSASCADGEESLTCVAAGKAASAAARTSNERIICAYEDGLVQERERVMMVKAEERVPAAEGRHFGRPDELPACHPAPSSSRPSMQSQDGTFVGALIAVA